MKHLRILVKMAALLCALCLLGGCAPSVNTLPLRLGVMYSSDIVPLVIMQEQKLDQKYGITLEMQVFSSAKDRDAALQAGELEGVFTDYIGMCIYQNAGLDLKISGVTDGDYQLVAGAASGVSSLVDASGVSVAISENTLIEYSLDYLLEQQGYPPDYLQKEVVPRIPDRLELLRTGGVPMSLLPDPFAPIAVSDGAMVLDSANRQGLYPAVSAFTEEALQHRRGQIESFYLAYDDAVDYLNNTPLSAYEPLVISRAGYPEELAGQLTLPVYRKRQLPDPAALQHAIDWAAKKGLCTAALKPEQLLDTK